MIKKEIRKQFLNHRKKFVLNYIQQLNQKDYEKFYDNYLKSVISILKENKLEKNIISGFFPIKNEIDCLQILNGLQKDFKICLPQVIDKLSKKMIFREFTAKDYLIIDVMKVPCPSEKNKISHPNVVLTPLLAFDKFNFRLGYGGGFYDTYFKNNINILKIGLAFEIQRVDKLIVEPHDVPLDYVITEKEIYKNKMIK